MSVNFAYSLCLSGTAESRATEAIKNQCFIQSDVSYSAYSKVYKPNPKKTLIFGKAIAPFAFIGYGIIQSVYHVALAIFKGVALWLSQNDSCYFKSHYFSAVRHVEQGSGWLIRIFHDKLGSFLIEDAQYHISHYKLFIDSEEYIDQSSFSSD